MHRYRNCDCRDGRDGRDGRDSRDGRDGRDGRDRKYGRQTPIESICITNVLNTVNEIIHREIKCITEPINSIGATGPTGATGATGPMGPICSPASKNINMFSFTQDNSVLLHILNKVNEPITYICIAWSSPSKECIIEIKDHMGQLVQKLILGPAPSSTSKNIYEHTLCPPITTTFNRLLIFVPNEKITIYSISVETSPK